MFYKLNKMWVSLCSWKLGSSIKDITFTPLFIMKYNTEDYRLLEYQPIL